MGPFLATPARPRETSLAEARAPRGIARLVVPSLRALPNCTIAPAPLVPPVSTPSHCDTTHCTLETLLVNVIVMGPLPGDALNARKTMSRLVGVPCVSKSVFATTSHFAIPPPVILGLITPDERRISTAIVMSALGAGAIEAVV